jgi:hypothetical protein
MRNTPPGDLLGEILEAGALTKAAVEWDDDDTT